jgi:carbonic anhydrase
MNEMVWYRSQQSPIDIHKDQTLQIVVKSDYLTFLHYNSICKGHFILSNHHWNFVLNKKKINPPSIKFGNRTAKLVKIHTHQCSEHDLEGQNRPGEVHLIHEVDRPAVGDSTLIVLGVTFDHAKVAKSRKSAKNAAMIVAEPSDDSADDVIGPVGKIIPEQLIAIPHYWYTYEGSLTTPDFDEVVTWVVFEKILNHTSQSLMDLDRYACQPERKVKPLNRRHLLRNFA